MDTMTRAKKVALPGVVAGLALLVSACSQVGLAHHYQKMRPNMIEGRWDVAAAQMDEAKEKVYGEKDRVMFWLNLGAIQHYAGDFEGSNQHLVKAEEAIQELWTKSISSEAGKVMLGESFHAYAGEDFEKVLIYLFTSLNNMKQGKVQDALVEARRADEVLKKMQVQYDKDPDVDSIYKQDAFMLWLVGLYYELDGSLNDAYLAYRASYEAYKAEYAGNFGCGAPSWLAEDMVRTAQLSGLADEAERWKQEAGATGQSLSLLAEGMGELILIHGNGEAPFKTELRFDAKMPDDYVMSMALPQFIANPSQIAYAEVSVNGQTVRTELAEPVTSIVLKNFEFQLPGLKARAIARAIVKYAATKAAKEAGGGSGSALGSILGLAANIAAVVTESADLRSWTLLPSEVRVARVWLPEGTHEATVSYHTASGAQVGRTDRLSVTVSPGQKNIQSVRTVL